MRRLAARRNEAHDGCRVRFLHMDETRKVRLALSGDVASEATTEKATIVLPDGQMRRIYLSEHDAARVIRYGRVLPRPWWWRLAFGVRAPSAFLALLIAGLVIPAITRQWS